MTDTNKITPEQPEGQAEPTPEAWHPEIQRELDKLPGIAERIKKGNQAMFIAEALEKQFPGSYMWKGLGVFHDPMVAFKFMAMSEAAAVLRWLASEHDLHIQGSMHRNELSGNLHWNLPGLLVIGDFSSPDARCKFVQTGTKSVPVYEMKCDGEAVPEEVAHG